MDIAIGIVGHTKRSTQAADLMDDVGAVYRSIDNGVLGCNANHRRVWSRLARYNTDWSLVLEDDAQPAPNFRHQLEQALTTTPAPVVSLYLGTGRPIWFEMAGRGSAQKLQPLITTALTQAAEQDACFITAPKLFHAVAVAIRTDLIGSMLEYQSPKPIDFAIGDWCVTEGHTVAYTVPSLIQHEDGPTVIGKHPDGEPRLQPRKAHQFGTRPTWNSNAIPLGSAP